MNQRLVSRGREASSQCEKNRLAAPTKVQPPGQLLSQRIHIVVHV